MGQLTFLNLPIGNVSDITGRSLEALKQAGIFVVEDTRSFKALLGYLKIDFSNKQIFSLHDQSHANDVKKIGDLLDTNDQIFYCSEAGSPIISDPALPLITMAIERGHKIDTFSGISSPIAALELSGLPCHPFTFLGFLAREKGKLEKMFSGLAGQSTYVFFESPHRIIETLSIASDCLPLAKFAVCREISKLYQSVYRFSGSEFINLKSEIVQKGEFVVVLYLPPEAGLQSAKLGENGKKLSELSQEILERGPHKKTVAKLIAQILGMDVSEVYKKLSSG